MLYNIGMSEAHSKASKARWKDIPATERSRIMSGLAKRKNKLMGVEGRRAHALKMVKARKYGTL